MILLTYFLGKCVLLVLQHVGTFTGHTISSKILTFFENNVLNFWKTGAFSTV